MCSGFGQSHAQAPEASSFPGAWVLPRDSREEKRTPSMAWGDGGEVIRKGLGGCSRIGRLRRAWESSLYRIVGLLPWLFCLEGLSLRKMA